LLDFGLSTLAFFIAAYWIKRWLEEHDISGGLMRYMLVVVLATAVSLLVSAIVEKFQDKPGANQYTEMMQLLKQLSQ